MLNLLFVVNSLKPRGAEQQLFSFIKSLPPQFNVYVFSFSNSPEEFPEFFRYKDVKIYLSKFQGTYNILRFWPLIKCLQNEEIDIVITVGLGAALFLGRIAAFFFRIKIVYSFLNTIENFNNLPRFHGAYFDLLNQGVNKLLPMISKNSVYRFLPNSDKLVENIKHVLRRYEVRALYNGLHLSEFENINDPTSAREIESIIKQIDGHPTIVQAGALDANKNVLFTVKCIEEIKKKVNDVRLLIIGDGPQKEGLRNFINNNGLEGIVILGGQHTRANCLSSMRRSNVIVLTSRSESFPNVLLEGQTIGLPAVTFDVGAAKEIVEHNVTGFVVPNCNRTIFTKRIIYLLLDRKAAKEMGRKGQERIRNLFSMDIKVRKFLQMIEGDLCLLSASSCHKQ